MFRSIYAKILLWFWMVATGTAVVVMVTANVGRIQPRASLWMSLAGGVYAQGAVDLYLQGGQSALAQYMNEIERFHGIRATLVNPQGEDLLGKGVPAEAAQLVRKARETAEGQFLGGGVYTEAEPISTPRGTFVLIAQVHPWQALGNPALLRSMMVKLSLAVICTGLLCALIAHHIAKPIRALQAAARRIAEGDLSVRTIPAIGRRDDELAELSRDFDRMAARLEELLSKQQQLLGDISHELRSPLTRLNVSLELLRRGEIDAIEQLQNDLSRMDELIGQILTLNRLELDVARKRANAVDLRSVVEGVAEDACFEGKHEQKRVIVAHTDDCWLQGDAMLLRSCIENVVRNAVRHTSPQTEVTISLKRSEDTARQSAQILVLDRGDGVPQECLAHLFEPFYRVSEARDLRTGGFGLGLAIAQRAARLHGGKITPRNRYGGGLEILIEFPLMPEA
jgi:two-component system, OmpR family, sensor histidine kinase CpxA